MIVRTPPPKKQRHNEETPKSPVISTLDVAISVPSGFGLELERPLVIYEEPPSALPPDSSSHQSPMMCTYQCRQMVKADFLEALSTAEKQNQDYKSQLDALSHNFAKVGRFFRPLIFFLNVEYSFIFSQ